MVMRSPLAEARNDSAAPRQGELVAGRYRVEGVIGSGGMGRVVAARDEAGRAVAIKLLLSPPSERVWVERFFREARAVSRINSAHVIKVVAVSSPNEATPFIVMERLRGRDFGKRLRAEGPLSLRDVSDCIVQACDALASSHHVGVVHRDVKPSNLFDHVNGDGTHSIKVLDFGISKARGHEEFEHTLTTSRDGMLGSPPYMSPEHIRDARSVDHRTDIWSLGVVAYQLLAGRLPFDGQSVGEVFCSVLERRFAPLSSVRPDLPGEIEAIIDRCLSREPGDRFQTAAELARAFAPYASPNLGTLVDGMTTTVPAAPVSGSSLVSRSAIPIATPGGLRLDGEAHTLTLPPAGSIEGGAHGALGRAHAPMLGRDDDIDIPPSRPFDVMSLPIPFDDLSPASVEQAKQLKEASRRTVALAIGAGALLFALLVTPFAMSHGSSSARTSPREGVIEPATAAVVTSLPNAPSARTAIAPIVPIAPIAPVAAEPRPTEPAGGDVTFEVQAPPKKAVAPVIRPSSRSSSHTSKTSSKAKEPAAARPAPEHVDAPPVAAPDPPKKPERPEIHPNPYNF
jgi:serine/threonine-protein kinase